MIIISVSDEYITNKLASKILEACYYDIYNNDHAFTEFNWYEFYYGHNDNKWIDKMPDNARFNEINNPSSADSGTYDVQDLVFHTQTRNYLDIYK